MGRSSQTGPYSTPAQRRMPRAQAAGGNRPMRSFDMSPSQSRALPPVSVVAFHTLTDSRDY
jgi:hypothetical protein